MEISRWIEENLKKVNLKRLTDSKLKAKTLEQLGAFVCLEKFAYCGQFPRLSSLHYGFLWVRSAAS